VLRRPLDPWQQWLVIHAGELLEDGITPRFRQVLVLVSRQNGKTEVLVELSLFWLYVETVNLVLGTSTNLVYAHESWDKAVQQVEANPSLLKDVPRNGIRRANGEQTLSVKVGPRLGRYKIAASNAKGGRSLTVDRLIMDELREHHDWSAYNAAVPPRRPLRRTDLDDHQPGRREERRAPVAQDAGAKQHGPTSRHLRMVGAGRRQAHRRRSAGGGEPQPRSPH
jgi:hypothetical protein